MKTKLLCIAASLLFAASVAHSTSLPVHAEGVNPKVATAQQEGWVSLYYDDFDRISLDATQDDIYQATIFGMQEANNASIVSHDGREKVLKFTRQNQDTVGYIGTGKGAAGLDQLVSGKTYKMSMYLDVEISEGSTFCIDYTASNGWWTCVNVTRNGVSAANPDNIHNLTYVNKILSFEFTGQPSIVPAKLVFYPSAANDTVYIDDFSISARALQIDYDFNAFANGLGAFGDRSDLSHIWNGAASEANIVVAGEEGSKYLSITNDKTGDNWQNFYFNQLDPIFAGTKYTMDMTFASFNWIEAYLYVPGNWDGAPMVTISPEGNIVYSDPNQTRYSSCSFVDNVLSFTYLASNDYQSNQVNIILKNNGPADTKISNIRLYDADYRALEVAKAQAYEALNVNENNYLAEDFVTVKEARDNAVFAIANDVFIDAVNTHKENALTQIAAVPTKEVRLQEAKDAANATLDSFDNTPYSDAKKEEIAQAIVAAKESILQATTSAEVEEAIRHFNEVVAKIPTAIEEAKANAIAKVESIPTKIALNYNYKQGEFSNVRVRFGATMSVEEWDSLKEYVTEYGVIATQTSKLSSSTSTLKAEFQSSGLSDMEAFVHANGYSIVRVEGNAPEVVDGNIVFQGFIQVPNNKLGVGVNAVAYVKIDGEYIFFTERENMSAKDIANVYLTDSAYAEFKAANEESLNALYHYGE